MTVENFRPVPIIDEGSDVLTFGTPIFEKPPPDQRLYGNFNRITGRFEFKELGRKGLPDIRGHVP